MRCRDNFRSQLLHASSDKHCPKCNRPMQLQPVGGGSFTMQNASDDSEWWCCDCEKEYAFSKGLKRPIGAVAVFQVESV